MSEFFVFSMQDRPFFASHPLIFLPVETLLGGKEGQHELAEFLANTFPLRLSVGFGH